MRDSLHWSYSVAGFMNTLNALGYLAGALLASRLIKRFGLGASIRWATVACVLALALCAMTGNFVALSFARLLIGVAAAVTFIGGGQLTVTLNAADVAASGLLTVTVASPAPGGGTTFPSHPQA